MRNKIRPIRIFVDNDNNEYLLIENKKIKIADIPNDILYKIMKNTKFMTNKRTRKIPQPQILQQYKNNLNRVSRRGIRTRTLQENKKDSTSKTVDLLVGIIKDYFNQVRKKDDEKQNKNSDIKEHIENIDKRNKQLAIEYKKDLSESVNLLKADYDNLLKKMDTFKNQRNDLGINLNQEMIKNKEKETKLKIANDTIRVATQLIPKYTELIKENKTSLIQVLSSKLNITNIKDFYKDFYNLSTADAPSKEKLEKMIKEKGQTNTTFLREIIESDVDKAMKVFEKNKLFSSADYKYVADVYLDEFAKELKYNVEKLAENDEQIAEVKEEGKGKKNDHKGGLYDYEINEIMKSFPYYYGAISEDEIDTIIKKIGKDQPEIFSFIYLLVSENKYPNGHWVAIYCDTKYNKECDYFNSFGEDAPNELKEKIKNMIENKYKLPYVLKWKYNTHVLQPDESNLCGMYSCWILYQLYFGVPFKEATEHQNKYKLDKQLKQAEITFGFI